MESVEVVYYTCLNDVCPKYRNVFREGDPEHESCARERLWREGQEGAMPQWLWFAIPAALALMIAAGATLTIRRMRGAKRKPPMLREEKKTWSGAQAHREEREGSSVPPPIST
jgi:hypothetical protein